MRRRTLSQPLIPFVLWVCAGAAALTLIFTIGNDTLSVLVAGAVMAGVSIYTIYAMGFHLLSAPVLYIGMLGVFHLGLVVPWALGIYDPYYVDWFHRAELTPAMGLVSLALVSLQLGLILGGRYFGFGGASPSDNGRKPASDEDRGLFQGSLVLLAFSAVLYVVGFGLVIGWNLSSYNYRLMFSLIQEEDSRWLGAATILIPVGIYCALASARRNHIKWLLPLAGCWVVWSLFLGSRNKGLLVALVAAFILRKRGFRIPRRVAILAGIVLIIVIPAVSILRQESDFSQLGETSIEDFHPLHGFAEMGQSIWPVIETHRLISSAEHRHGMTYLAACTTILPNLSLSYKPGASFGSIEQRVELFPSLWLVWTTNTYVAKRYGAYGFSSIAEAYLNFGYVGVAIILIGLGVFLVRMQEWRISSAYVLAAQAIVLAPLLWYVRNDFTVVARPVAWGLTFLCGAWLVFSKLRTLREKATPAKAWVGRGGMRADERLQPAGPSRIGQVSSRG